MVMLVTRVVGVLLALAGLALTVAGVWFALRLGSDGTAEFSARPEAASPVLIAPDVLNRVDSDVVVTATPSEGAGLWMARANPSDADAVLGDARRVEITGVDIRDWLLTTRTTGTEEPPTLGNADLWRQQDDGQGPVTLTVTQEDAPESLVISSADGLVSSVTLTVSDKRWFVESVVAVLIGLFLLAAGVIAVWPRRRSAHPETVEPASTVSPTTVEEVRR
ncbi:hypothetical protein JQN72_14520 [Phycicoccus sp. CSK15P-2]|uniref:hypothetical protein n=1 Tax=Phycicoccus sp. CSK15P-2 TaxID=2807627 RepID=UPI0019520043|nr:hypothetical protein [Phycicoccus sp. CSK15P-2]MBM6405457.1 hypothetical protein [Phycicoccus sp. CSK15P-2]